MNACTVTIPRTTHTVVARFMRRLPGVVVVGAPVGRGRELVERAMQLVREHGETWPRCRVVFELSGTAPMLDDYARAMADAVIEHVAPAHPIFGRATADDHDADAWSRWVD